MGPRPSTGSSATATPAGSGGNSCPGAATTTTGPSTARDSTAAARKSNVDPCHSSPAFAAPIRVDRPPASTTPAAITTPASVCPEGPLQDVQRLEGVLQGSAH